MSALAEKIQRYIRSLHYTIGIESQLYRNQSLTDVVLMYHNVLPVERSDIHLRNISQDQFRKQIRYFKKHFHIVPLRNLFDYPHGTGRLAITFDDGLVNNLRYAKPILEEEGVPATFFITTTWLHGECSLWPDELSIHLRHIPSTFEFRKELYHRKSPLHFRGELTNRTIQDVLLDSDPAEISSFLKYLSGKTGILPSQNAAWEDMCRIMNGEEIKLLAENGLFEIGSHALTHHNLLRIPFPKVIEELRDSKDYLQRVTGKPVESIAYPFGLYSREMIDISESLGYKRQLAVNYRFKEDGPDKRILSRTGLYCDRSITEQIHQVWLANSKTA